MARTFREVFRWLLPSWLTEGEGGLVAYSLAVMKDAYLERVYQGLVARFPSYATSDALAEIGIERGLKQGADESAASYVARLQAWRTPKTHKVRGTAFAAIRLAQIAAGAGTYVRSIDSLGNQHTITAAGVEAYAYGIPWPWDSLGATRARFWLELKTVPNAAANTYDKTVGTTELWTDATGNETLGIAGVSPRKMSDLRDLFSLAPQWKPAGTRAMWAVINLTGGVVTPDPTWEYWSKLVAGSPSTQTPARNSAFRYVQLNVTDYVERVQYAGQVAILSGVLKTGNAAAATWGAVTLPDSKASYAGVPTSYPTAIRLPDDGDFISGVL